MPEGVDPYKVLQVDPEAEDEVIQAAYRRLARKYHPDLATTHDAAARMAAINTAWELIGEPAARAAFDRQRGRSTSTPVSPSAATGSAGSGPASAPGRGGSPQGAGAVSTPGSRQPPTPPPPPPTETISRDWTSGRSMQGGGYDESMRAADGFGAAGPPPGRPSGTVLNFGRYAGWSLGEIARTDMEYIEWLDRAPIGRNYRAEIDQILRTSGRRKSADAGETERRGLFRRR
jgi:curved DNA-binding protein CbpA